MEPKCYLFVWQTVFGESDENLVEKLSNEEFEPRAGVQSTKDRFRLDNSLTR
jgi:hypothetical protein